MTNLRQYIDLVEKLCKEGFIGSPPLKRQRPFGRRGVGDDAPSWKPRPPVNPKHAQELEDCKHYKSADEYANAHNMYYPVSNTDPQHIHNRARDEHDRLKTRWNHYKAMGHY